MAIEVVITPEEEAIERWRPIAGFSSYEVSDMGRVRSRRATTTEGGGVLAVPRVMRFGHLYGYPNASLVSDSGKPKAKRVHHLVLEAFVGPRPPRHEGRHFPDRDPRNNRLTNLSWSTHVVNIGDKRVHGTLARGERNGSAKLSYGAVMLMRYLRACHGTPTPLLADWFGVSGGCASDVVHGRKWSHVPMLGVVRRHGDFKDPVTGKQIPLRGEANPTAVLTWSDVSSIRNMAKDRTYSHRRIAADFGVSRSTVTRIVSGQNWREP